MPQKKKGLRHTRDAVGLEPMSPLEREILVHEEIQDVLVIRLLVAGEGEKLQRDGG